MGYISFHDRPLVTITQGGAAGGRALGKASVAIDFVSYFSFFFAGRSNSSIQSLRTSRNSEQISLVGLHHSSKVSIVYFLQ